MHFKFSSLGLILHQWFILLKAQTLCLRKEHGGSSSHSGTGSLTVPSPPQKCSHEDIAGEEDNSRLKGWVLARTGWKTPSSWRLTPWLCPCLPLATSQDQGARSPVHRHVGQSRTNYLWSADSSAAIKQNALFRWLIVRQDISHMWHTPPRHHQPKFNTLRGAKGIALFWLPVKSHAAVI